MRKHVDGVIWNLNVNKWGIAWWNNSRSLSYSFFLSSLTSISNSPNFKPCYIDIEVLNISYSMLEESV